MKRPFYMSDMAHNDGREFAPAVQKNRDPILDVLKTHLPDTGTVLEIASGTGEHAAYFISHFPNLYWQPTDLDVHRMDSIRAWCKHTNCDRLLPPQELDTTSQSWLDGVELPSPITAILSCNMIHIAPWDAAVGLMKGAERTLPPGGTLILYGPYMKEGAHTSPSNADFDANLKSRNPSWGLRDVMDVEALAKKHGLELKHEIAMPSNNTTLIFTKTPPKA